MINKGVRAESADDRYSTLVIRLFRKATGARKAHTTCGQCVIGRLAQAHLPSAVLLYCKALTTVSQRLSSSSAAAFVHRTGSQGYISI